MSKLNSIVSTGVVGLVYLKGNFEFSNNVTADVIMCVEVIYGHQNGIELEDVKVVMVHPDNPEKESELPEGWETEAVNLTFAEIDLAWLMAINVDQVQKMMKLHSIGEADEIEKEIKDKIEGEWTTDDTADYPIEYLDSLDEAYEELLNPEKFVKHFKNMDDFKAWCSHGNYNDLYQALKTFEDKELYEHCAVIKEVMDEKALINFNSNE